MEAHEAQAITYSFCNAIGGLIEAMGMQAKNQERLSRGESIAYDDEAFNKLLLDRGLHHNALMAQIYR